MKSVNRILKEQQRKFKIPKSVQDTIPIDCLYMDGIFRTDKVFSMTWRINDINYVIASEEDKAILFRRYESVLNGMDVGAITKLSIYARKLNRAEFEKTKMIPFKNDQLDPFRKEYNDMLLNVVTMQHNSIIQEIYITISVYKGSVDEARNYFRQKGVSMQTALSALSSHAVALDAVERLRIFHDFYRAGEESNFLYGVEANEMEKIIANNSIFDAETGSFKDISKKEKRIWKNVY